MFQNLSTIAVMALLGSLALFAHSCKAPQVLSARVNMQSADSLLNMSGQSYRIKPDDKLSVSVWQHDDLSVGSVFGIYNSSEGYGKWVLVDERGMVVLPKLGSVIVAGSTPEEAADTLRNRLSRAIIDPIVVVKVLNREVTVLGEVRTPGNFLLDQEHHTLSEVIGRAQGFTDYANVRKLILQRNGQSFQLDLSRLTVEQQSRITMNDGDVIEVPAKGGKRIDKKAPTLIPFASVMTALAIAFATFTN